MERELFLSATVKLTCHLKAFLAFVSSIRAAFAT